MDIYDIQGLVQKIRTFRGAQFTIAPELFENMKFICIVMKPGKLDKDCLTSLETHANLYNASLHVMHSPLPRISFELRKTQTVIVDVTFPVRGMDVTVHLK